jgi:hypothetical protein
MPAFLDAGDRRLVIVAAAVMLVLVGATYVFREAPEEQDIGDTSSYSNEWLGTKAAFLLLQQSGYRVERWVSPPEELPEGGEGTTLIFAEPPERPSSDDRAAVARFISAGGRLLVMGASGATFAPQSSARAIPEANLTPRPFSAVLPSTLSRNAREITMVAPDAWTNLAPGQLSVYERQGKPGVVWYRFGKGQVIWWAIASPMSNGTILDEGNLALLFNSVGPPGTRVIWDEYFHGVRRSLNSYFARTPLPWAALQVVLGLAALVFTFSRRSGPVRMPASESRPSPLEFVDTLGDLYQSAHAAAGVVGIAYQRLRLLLTRKLGLAPATKLPELAHVAAVRYGWPEDALFQTLAQSERAMRDIELADSEALELVRELQRYAERLEPAGPKERVAWRLPRRNSRRTSGSNSPRSS